MSYTDYLLKEDFINLDSLVSDNKYLRDMTAILPCVLGIVGVVLITSVLPVTITVDTINRFRK
jgi:hypothetical protein